VPLESYGPIVEKFVRDFLSRKQESWTASPSEVLNEIGSLINDENSILRACYLKNVPIISPGIVDSAFGTTLLFSYQKGKFKLDVMKDEKLMSDKIFEKKRSGAIILGGGISKHHTLWWNQYKEGLDYVIAITTAYEFDGSLSGARISEAISWNKVKPEAEVSNIYGDATVILPLLLAAFYEAQNPT
ncbi:MAG: deoxyhypusine synthase family protein, partial [Thermoproteota archaeon]